MSKSILIAVLSALLLIMGCGGSTASDPVIIEKEVIKEVVKEVVKEVFINKFPLTGCFELVVTKDGVVDAKTLHSNIRMLTEYMVENEDMFN